MYFLTSLEFKISQHSTRKMEVAGLAILITRKKMKNLRLRVQPPHGDIAVSAPLRASVGDITRFVSFYAPWIRQQQELLAASAPPLAFEAGEQHWHWGKAKTLQLSHSRHSFVESSSGSITLHLPQTTNVERKAALLNTFYRDEVLSLQPELGAKYEQAMAVSCLQWRARKMKTRWGSCNIQARRIWLNTSLAKYPQLCLDYVIAHELAHLLERNHNRRFWGIVESHCPHWQRAKTTLAEGPQESAK